ncbi:hypothetical protein V8G54_012238 [Vigna mungo]|uniref:Uncharacterized protein n=1 Tax=Vigna mungo TaxID=3915 RepID=A0AAQ3S239_VIGMU
MQSQDLLSAHSASPQDSNTHFYITISVLNIRVQQNNEDKDAIDAQRATLTLHSSILTSSCTCTQVLGLRVVLAPILECWNVELFLLLDSGVGMLSLFLLFFAKLLVVGGEAQIVVGDIKGVLETRDDHRSDIDMDDGVGVVIIENQNPTTTLHRRHACASLLHLEAHLLEDITLWL